jgi:hypothetical protein
MWTKSKQVELPGSQWTQDKRNQESEKKQTLSLEKQEGMHKVRSKIILNGSESAAVSHGGNNRQQTKPRGK